jgi:FAD binding domain/Berberine and berberine like
MWMALSPSAYATSGFNDTNTTLGLSTEQWEAFNSTISGNLHQTIPYAASCYANSPYYDPSTCDVIEANYTIGQDRSQVYGNTIALNWETCQSQTCALNAGNISETLSTYCSLGRLSSYYVDAHEPSHVVAAVQFAQAHDLRVTIKNTGHDYFGRSTSPNTLAIWTHNLKDMIYHANFTALNCSASNGQNIGEMGAGTQASDAYIYFQNFNMDVAGGNEGSVGLAGGFGQGGGHGVFGPSFGLMVDNAVEFDVVTADGQLRTINQCNDPDLFWAMRGGGGGTFGILTSYRFQLHPAQKINVYSFTAEFILHDNETTNYPVLEEILTQHATNQPVWSHNNISGHAYYWPTKAEITLVLPSNNETALETLTSEFSSFLTSNADLNVTESNYTTYEKYTEYLALTEAIALVNTPSGIFELLAGRLIPQTLFEQEGSNIFDLVSAIIQGVQISNELVELAVLQIIMTTPINHQNGNETSANPAWRSALWHLLMTGAWTDELPVDEQTLLAENFLTTIGPLKELTEGGGCYVNEGHYLEPDWQETFYGSNYPRLLEVKQEYDPTHFFDCWKCVGWEGPSE